MSFFDVPPPPEPERHQRPAWSGPPDGVLPAVSAQRVVLVATEQVVLAADRFLAYPTGVAFTLSLFTRTPNEEMHGPPFELRHQRNSEPLPDDFIRFGMQFGDGTKWTNLNWNYPRHDETPVGPIVIGRGGGGGGTSWEMGYWIWPLPPAGPITMVVSWPAHGIEERTVKIDGDELRTLAESAEAIW